MNWIKKYFLLGDGARSWEYETFSDPKKAKVILRYSQGSDSTRTIMSWISHVSTYGMVSILASTIFPLWTIVSMVSIFAVWQDIGSLKNWKGTTYGLRIDVIHDLATKIGGAFFGYWLSGHMR